MKKFALKSMLVVLFAIFMIAPFFTVTANAESGLQLGFSSRLVQLGVEDDPEPEFAYPTPAYTI